MAGRMSILRSYEEQESATDRQSRIAWWDQNKVRKCRIAVMGAGATGNEVIKNLALLGVGYVCICDMDTISTSNLSRTVLFTAEDVGKYKAEVAAERFQKMSVCPDVKVDYFIGDIIHQLGNGFFRQFDVILGCMDNLDARLSINKRCNLLKVPYIDTGINELTWGIRLFHFPKSSCFACEVSGIEMARERGKRHSCDGKRMRFVQEEKLATVLISAAPAAAMAVQEAMKLVCGMDVEFGRKYVFEGLNNSFERIRIRKKENCPSGHFSYDCVEETPFDNHTTVKAFLEWVSAQNDGREYFIDLLEDGYDWKNVTSCPECGRMLTLQKPGYALYKDEYFCEDCRKRVDMNGYFIGEELTESIDALKASDERVSSRTLEEIGIAKGHILTLRDCEDTEQCRFYELTADLPAMFPNLGLRQVKHA